MNLLQLIAKIIDYYTRFGYRGLLFLLKRSIKRNSIVAFLHPEFNSIPIYLRNNTMDVTMFQQVFFNQEYQMTFKFEPKVILDCGANIGLATVYLKNRFPEATIISIEPEQSNFELLVKNTKDYSDVFCLKNGIWNESSNLIIKDEGLGNCGFMVEETNKYHKDSIEAITIVDIMKRYDIDSIDILKIDIEGSEKELFESGYEEWLPKVKVIIIELHDWLRNGTSKSFFKALSNYNFSISIEGENVYVFMNL